MPTRSANLLQFISPSNRAIRISSDPLVLRSHSNGLANTSVLADSSRIIQCFGWTPEAVYFVFIEGAIGSYIEDALVVITSLLAGVPLLIAFKKLLNLKNPLS